MILESEIGNYVYSGNKKYLYFGGNDYLGLGSHPSVKSAVIKAVKKYGSNFSASRRTTGTSLIHIELEKQLSAFKGEQDTVIFASGFQGNGILLEILKERYSNVLIDELAHSSIKAAVPRDKKISYYKHSDAGHLDYLLNTDKITSPLIITDGVFALTGEIAALDKIHSVVMKHDGMLVVDDAHSTGILGDSGRGTPEHFNLQNNVQIYQTETMSKALGSYGGFISGEKDLIELIRNNSTVYQASTALPPPVVAASIASLKLISEKPGLRTELLRKASRLKEEITGMCLTTTRDRTPIVPLIMSSRERAKSLSNFMEENGIITPFVNYPANKLHLVRITITINHSDLHTEKLLDKLNKWIKQNGKD